MAQFNFDPHHQREQTMALVMALNEAFKATMKALIEEKATEDLSWLEELRSDTIRSVKGLVGSQMSIEVEAAALTFAIKFIEDQFDQVRVFATKGGDRSG